MSDYQQSAASTSNARQVNNSGGSGSMQSGCIGGNLPSTSGQGSEPSTYLPFQNLQIYSQMTILEREPGAPLPTIRNPGLLVEDVTAPLIEGVHYNPEQYVIVPGKDLFLQGKLLALYGKQKFSSANIKFNLNVSFFAFRTFVDDTPF